MDEGAFATAVVLPVHCPECVYLTRDADEITGELSSVVDVWASMPHFSSADGGPGLLWLGYKIGDDPDTAPPPVELLTRVHVDAARQHWNTLPDTARECIRIRR